MKRSKARAAGAAVLLFTLLLAAALCFSAVDIFFSGRALRQSGSPAAPIYTPEAIWARGKYVLPLAALWLISVLTALLLRKNAPEDASPKERGPSSAPPPPPDAPAAWARPALFALAAALIVLGAANGGLHDVLVKAIQICTECIGLG